MSFFNDITVFYLYNTLVARPSKRQGYVSKGFHVFAIDNDVDVWQDLPEFFAGLYLLDGEPGVEPDVLCGHGLLYLSRQCRDVVGRAQGVAAREREPLDVWLLQFGEEIVVCLFAEWSSAFEIPRVGVLASLAMVGAACHPKGDAESFAIVYVATCYVVKSHVFRYAKE